VDALREIFESGDVSAADLEAQDPRFLGTPLHWAIRGGYEEAVRFLIARGADLGMSVTDDYDNPCLTALDLAAECGHAGITQILLDAGAGSFEHHREHREPNDGCRALKVAAREGKDEVVRVLLAWSRSTGQPVNKHITVCNAAEGYHVDVLRTVLDFWKISPETDGELLNVALCCACSAPRDEPSYEVRMELEKARRERQKPTAVFLLDAGADVNFFWERNDTSSLLNASAIPNAADVVQLLLNRGADVFIANHIRQTALYYAAESMDESTAKLLLEHGADVNARDFVSQTPLHRAAYLQAPFVQLLLDHGADPAARDAEGKTPWDLAEKGKPASGAIFVEAGQEDAGWITTLPVN
jgi:ankyrin repeat protein